MSVVCPTCHGRGQVARPIEPLTPKQRNLLHFITAYIVREGIAPSNEEIAAYFGFASLATVHEHLTNLERKGRITRRYKEARSIQLLECPA